MIKKEHVYINLHVRANAKPSIFISNGGFELQHSTVFNSNRNWQLKTYIMSKCWKLHKLLWERSCPTQASLGAQLPKLVVANCCLSSCWKKTLQGSKKQPPWIKTHQIRFGDPRNNLQGSKPNNTSPRWRHLWLSCLWLHHLWLCHLWIHYGVDQS